MFLQLSESVDVFIKGDRSFPALYFYSRDFISLFTVENNPYFMQALSSFLPES